MISIDFFQNVYKNSILFIIITFLERCFKNSYFYSIVIKDNNYDFIKTSLVANYLITLFYRITNKLQNIKIYIDRFVDFCLKNSFKKVIVAFSIIIITNPFLRNNILANFVFIPLLSLIFLICILNYTKYYITKEHQKLISYIIIISFLLKFIFLVIIHFTVSFSDELSYYHEFSLQQANLWLDNQKELNKDVEGGLYFYNYFIATIYFFFGSHIIIAKLFNLFIHILSGIFIYLISKEIFNIKSGIIALLIFFILPPLSLWSLVLLREGIAVFTIILTFYLLIKVQKRFSIITLVLLYISLQILYDIRSYIYNILFLSVIFGFIIFKIYQLANKNKLFKVLALLVLIIFSLYLVNYIKKIDPILKETNSYFSGFNHYRNVQRVGKLAFPVDVDVSTPEKALKFLPTALLYGMFSPLPNQMMSFNLLLYFISNMIWYFLVPFVIIGLWFAIKKHFFETSGLIIYSILTLVSLSLIEGNIGNLMRHSMMYVSVLIIFGAYELSHFLPEKLNVKRL